MTTLTDTDAAKIRFPCTYPIKVMGDGAADYEQFVVDAIARHAALTPGKPPVLRKSRNGRYHAVTVWIEATGERQLVAIFEELKSSSRVKMVL